MSGPVSLRGTPAVAPIQITKKLLQALAPLPTTVLQLLALLDDPNASLRQIGEVASRDVGIAATLLRMANSPLMGMRGRVGSISDALRLIGTVQARLLVLSCGVAQAGQKELPLYGLPAGAFLRHSELVANLTVALARQTGYLNAGAAYSAGLLHDIGKVVLNGLARQHGIGGQHGDAFAAAVKGQHAGLLATEHAFFGTTHPAMGRELASLWALPDDLAEAIGSHHGAAPAGASSQSLAACVALANAVAVAADSEYPAINRIPMPAEPLVPIEPLLTIAADSLRGDDAAPLP